MYLEKRKAVIDSKVHLIELDLLRGGERLPMAAELPAGDMYVFVSRGSRRPLADVWPIDIAQRLPIIAVPLRGEDADVPLDLQAVVDSVYERARYDLCLDHSRPVEPAAWVDEVLRG